MNEELDKIFNKNDKLDSQPPKKSNHLIEAVSLMRTVYWPKPNSKGHFKYFASNEEIEFATSEALDKFGIEPIRKFYFHCEQNKLFGIRDSWSIWAITEDIDAFLGNKKEEPKNEKPQISDFEQSCRYIHLVYGPNDGFVDILKEPPILELIQLTEKMTSKFGHKAIEILIDYCNWHKKALYKEKWTIESVENDIKKAIRWSIQKPDEYLKTAK